MQDSIFQPIPDEDLKGVTGLYVLRARTPYVAQTGQCKKSFRFYIGWAKDISLRVESHRKGLGREQSGARCTQVWFENNIEFDVVFIIAGATKHHERRLKDGGHYEERITRFKQDPEAVHTFIRTTVPKHWQYA